MQSNRFFEKTLDVLPPELAALLCKLPELDRHYAQEIRLRVNRPLAVVIKGASCFMTADGRVCSQPDESAFIVTQPLLEDCFLRLCGYSVHSHQEEIRQGFITTVGGDRAGICASAVRNREGTLTYRDVSSINIRISRESVGCAKGILRLLDPKKGVLIAGMPSSGKTTLLRDAVRSVASGEQGSFLKVAVVDERYELSAARQGLPLYDLGVCSDIICGQSKAQAIEQAVRTLSPDIVACDEIGSESEIAQLDAGLCCGVTFFATVHCGGRGDLLTSRRIRSLMDTGAFGYLLLLDSPRFPTRASFIYTAEDYYAKACGLVAAV